MHKISKQRFSLMFILMALTLFLTVTVGAQGVEYNESPMLAERVAAGQLPPVAERLPEEPAVITPVEEIGQYGSTIRVASLSPTELQDGGMVNTQEGIFRLGDGGASIEPNLATHWEFNEEGTELTLHLRRGVKWSDGHPFTADDLMFNFEDIVMNDDLTPVKPIAWSPGGELMQMEKVDDYTVRMHFAEPHVIVAELQLAHYAGTEGNFFRPKHYYEQFHPNYASEEDINRHVSEGGFESWVQMFLAKATMNQGYGRANPPEIPTLKAFRVTAVGTDRITLERNPYYWKVDSEGNQLPYVDRLVVTLVEDGEIYNLMAMAGELDFVVSRTTLENYPLYMENAQRGRYRVILWPLMRPVDLTIMFNQTVEDPVLREIFQDVRFRRAMSLAINRDDINELIYLGLGEPMQMGMVPVSQYYEPEFGEAYIEFNPEEASRLLDEMGLQRDAQGYRLRPDGQRLEPVLELATIIARGDQLELILQMWERELGIRVSLRHISNELQTVRAPANQMDMSAWLGHGSDILFPGNPHLFVCMNTGWENAWCPLWAQWYASGGTSGEEPPAEILRNYERWEAFKTTTDEEERVRLGKEIVGSQAENLWSVGTVGMIPVPVLVNENLRNVSEDNWFGWDTIGTQLVNPEQFFFRR